MRVFKTRLFAKWANKELLHDDTLRVAAKEIERGLYEASLGGFIFKKRIALGNRGKSAGARTIVAYRANNKLCFIYGYLKNAKSDLNAEEARVLKLFADEFFNYSLEEERDLLSKGKLIEVNNHD